MTISNAGFRFQTSDHEHDWDYSPPVTAGAKGVESCKCGLYRDPDPMKYPEVLIERWPGNRATNT